MMKVFCVMWTILSRIHRFLLEISGSHSNKHEYGWLSSGMIVLMMEAVSTSEMSVRIYHTTWRNFPQDIHSQFSPCMSQLISPVITSELLALSQTDMGLRLEHLN
jgi:hypothetical protein